MYYHQHYVVNWDKVESLEDVKAILKTMNVAFDPSMDISKIEHLVELEDKGTAVELY